MILLLNRYFGITLIGILICLTTSALQGQVLGKKTELKLKGDGTSGPFVISENYILIHTEKVLKDSIILEREKDYIIDYNKGLLWLFTPLGKDGSLTVNFEEFSSGIKKRYFHRELTFDQEFFNSTGGLIHLERAATFPPGLSNENIYSQKAEYPFKKAISQIPRDKTFSSNLQITGSKSFSLDLGNSEAFSLSQGLNLTVSGDLTRDVKVLALISDQGRGGTPAGTTKRLEELDKILMQVTSPNFQGFLGDQYLTLEGNLAGKYEKKLQGASSELKFNENSLSVSYASSKGKYYHNIFSGIEGKQGPYYLKGENGERGIQVLPGTEKVYLDGELIETGSDNDYTIDYLRGAIYFSSTRLVTGDSRIRVEFEYTDQSYEKSFYDSKAEFNLFQGKLKLKGLFIDERDDKDNPLSLAFSTEDKYILKSSGENKSKAFKDGVQYVGEGKGEYILLTDSSGNPYHQYAGKDSGTYLVSFSWVGDSKGSYVYKGGGIYSYVYPGNGDYLPVVFLPLPSTHSLLDLSLNINLFPGFSSEIGWGLSRKDLNSFSDLGDEDNSGNAFLFRTGLDKQNLSVFGHNLSKLKFEGLYRNLGENYQPLGRLDEIEKERVWGFSDDSTKGSEKVLRFKSDFSPVENLSLNADLGVLKKGDYFESKRRRFEIALRPFKNLETKGSTESIKSNQKDELINRAGNWQRRNLYLEYRWKKLNTQLGWENEVQAFTPQDSAFMNKKYDELKGKVSLESSRLWGLSSQLLYREDDRKDIYWRKESNSYTWQNQLALRDFKEVFSSNFEYIYRVKNLKSGDKTRGNLGVLKLDYYPVNQSLILNLYYSVNQLGSEKRVDNYLEVGGGRGEYRFENGEYVPDPDGNFILQSEVLDEYLPGIKLDKNCRMVFKPGNLFTRGKYFKEFYTDTFIRSSNQMSGRVNWSGFLLNPFSGGSTKKSILKDYSLSQDLYLFPSAPLNLRLRWTQDKKENLIMLSGKDKDYRTTRSALFRYRISFKNLLESEISQERREREKYYSDYLLIDGKSLELNFTRREKNSLELTLATKLKREVEKQLG
ncbi:MAG: hypothetical protein MUO78_08685, partial [candidate division Zixibacteria bacterium]|nr:hypothetical protein [candidate division Zixibacteria bacterium]